MENVFIRLVALPCHINALTMPNEDGTYEIYINSMLCQRRQIEALNHELNHIKKDHFYNDIKSIETVEEEAG